MSDTERPIIIDRRMAPPLAILRTPEGKLRAEVAGIPIPGWVRIEALSDGTSLVMLGMSLADVEFGNDRGVELN